MVDDPESITPPHGTPIPQQRRAEVHAGPRVLPPAETDAEWHRLRREDLTIGQAIQAARALLRIARNPRNDASWPHILGWLDEAEMQLAQRLDDASVARLEVVRKLKRCQRA